MPGNLQDIAEVVDEEKRAGGGGSDSTSSGFVARAAWTLLRAWHLLSLDAATVAVVWARLLARTSGVRLGVGELLILGLGTWLVYVGDRLLDGLEGRDPARLRERHLFYARYRRMMLAMAGAVAVLLLALICQMPTRLRLAYAGIFAVSMVYFLFVHWLSTGGMATPWSRWRGRLRVGLKEAAVAVLFSAACAAPAWTRELGNHRVLIPATLLFAALCWLNCTAIEIWESGRKPGIGLGAGTLALAAVVAARFPGMHAAGSAVAASALLLLAFDQTRLPPGRLRILADVALLTPLVFLLR